MSEIKSTFDLVMEKTKNLTLNDEEKQNLRYKDARKSLNGLFQKYHDRILTREQMKKELDGFSKNHGVADRKMLVTECVERIGLDQENRLFLELLQNYFSLDITVLESILNDYQDTVLKSTQNRANEIKENLATQHGVAGSAVVPNIGADTIWAKKAKEIRFEFDPALTREKAALTEA